MSNLGAIVRVTVFVASVGAAFNIGRVVGRYSESKDSLYTIEFNNKDAQVRLDAVLAQIRNGTHEIKEGSQHAIDALTHSVKTRIKNNVAIRCIWGDLQEDIEQIKKLAGLN